MKMITLPLGALETNCYVVYDEASKACALVDPGAMPQTILDTLEKNGLALQKIFLTHAHFDHTGALRALHEKFPDVPIYVNAQDTDETLNMSQGNLVYTDTFLDGDEISMAAAYLPCISNARPHAWLLMPHLRRYDFLGRHAF